MNPTKNQLEISLISYCGFYCGACQKFKKGECKGCKGDAPDYAVGYKACEIRPCCIGNGLNSCAECNTYNSVKRCKIYNPFLVRFGQFITRTSRRKGIEMINVSSGMKNICFPNINDPLIPLKGGLIVTSM